VSNPVRVEILGEQLTLLTDRDESYVRALASYLRKRVEEVLRSGNSVSTDRALILVALEMADECFRLRKAQRQTEEQLNVLLQWLDQEALAPRPPAMPVSDGRTLEPTPH